MVFGLGPPGETCYGGAMAKADPLRRRAPGSKLAGGGLRRLSTGLNRFPKKRGKEPDEGGVPVTPDRPLTLSGGAAAELEFDD